MSKLEIVVSLPPPFACGRNVNDGLAGGTGGYGFGAKLGRPSAPCDALPYHLNSLGYPLLRGVSS